LVEDNHLVLTLNTKMQHVPAVTIGNVGKSFMSG